MPSNEFIWCDLSTFDIRKACAFYAAVMGWTEVGMNDSTRGDDYTLLYSGSQSSAGVYTMPAMFQEIGMPSFWMSYVRVSSLSQKVELAVSLGAKCEIEPTALDYDSRFALIRDPSGAGFTLYEGPDLMGRDNSGTQGRMLWNELHVPSLAMVEGFYRNLFEWEIVPDRSLRGRFNLKTPSGHSIASILELDEHTKGPKNYWAVVFTATDINATLSAVNNNGGRILMQPDAGIGYAMAIDNQEAMFCISDAAVK